MANSIEHESIKMDTSRNNRDIHGRLRVVTFKDGDFVIAYLPSLNLSGYGNSETEAVDMLTQIVLKEYLMSLLKLSEAQIMTELREHGWKRRPYLDKQLMNPQFLDTKKIIQDFNLPAETQFNERFVTA